MTKEQVEANEQREFEAWVNMVHETYGENVSHFEHNLEVCLCACVWCVSE